MYSGIDIQTGKTVHGDIKIESNKCYISGQMGVGYVRVLRESVKDETSKVHVWQPIPKYVEATNPMIDLAKKMSWGIYIAFAIAIVVFIFG